MPKIFSPKNEADKIIKYLQNKNGQRDTKKPFCMIWAMNPPHNPLFKEKKYGNLIPYPTS